MEPITIIALVLAGLGVVGGSIPLFKSIFDKFKSGGVNLDTAKKVWAEDGTAVTTFLDDVMGLVNQGKAMSKAVDDQATAVDKINQNVVFRKALIETAGKHGTEAIEELARALTPVPKNFEQIAGIDVDKMTKIKEAQREGLSDKESFNKVLGDSGKMLRNIVGLAGEILPTITKLKK